MTLHTVSSRTLSPMSWSTGLTSRDSLRWYWALLAEFCSNWIIRSCRRVLQFFVINFLCLAAEVSSLSFKALNWQLMSDIWSSSSINFFLLKFSILNSKSKNDEGIKDTKRSVFYGNHTEKPCHSWALPWRIGHKNRCLTHPLISPLFTKHWKVQNFKVLVSKA